MEPEKDPLEPEEEENDEAPLTKKKKSLEGPSRSSARVKTTPSKFKESTDEPESNGETKKPRKRKDKEGKKEKEGGKVDKKLSEKKGDESAKKKRKAKVKEGEEKEEKPTKEKKPRKSKKSQETSEDSNKLFCCNAKYDDSKEYIGCSKEKACKSFEWFHVECVGLTHAQVAKLADWFCDACKKADAEAAEAASRASSSNLLEDLDGDLPDDDLGEGDLPEEEPW